MSKQVVQSSDVLNTGRTKINSNFTELYDANTSFDDHIADTENPHATTKTQVGLGNVPNTDATNPANISQSSSYRFVTDAEKAAWDAKQAALGYTPEDSSNKKTSLTDNSDTFYPSQKAVKTAVDAKSDLVTRVQSITSSATITPNCDSYDMVKVTAQAEAFTLANPTGTPTEGQMMVIRIKDNGTARAITFDTLYRAMGITLPTTTVLSKTLYLAIVYNYTDTKWDVINSLQQA